MLSFFRTKSTEATVDKIIEGTKGIAIKVDKNAIDIANCNRDESMSSNQINQTPNELLNSLGYHNESALRDKIFSKCISVRIFFLSRKTAFFMLIILFFYSYFKNNSRSRKTVNA